MRPSSLTCAPPLLALALARAPVSCATPSVARWSTYLTHTTRTHRYHSPAAIKTLELMSKSAPDATAAESAVSTSVLGVGFEALRQRLVAEGCFEPNYPDEAFKLVLTLGPGFLGYTRTLIQS